MQSFQNYWETVIVPEWGESEPIKEVTKETWDAAVRAVIKYQTTQKQYNKALKQTEGLQDSPSAA